MCKELEAVGLQDPEYRLNAFMLQTTIRNSTLTDKKPRFGEENHGLVDKKPLFQVIDDAVCNKILAPTISENMKEIVEAFDMNQIFGRKEVKKNLDMVIIKQAKQ